MDVLKSFVKKQSGGLKMRKTLWFVLIILLISVPVCSMEKHAAVLTGIATDVIEGDILILTTTDDWYLVDMYGITVPDITIMTLNGRNILLSEDFAPQSYMYFSKRILGQVVDVDIIDLIDMRKNHIALRGVIYDKYGMNINLEILRSGLAWINREELREKDLKEFQLSEDFARNNKVGVWGGDGILVDIRRKYLCD
jgi:endonuclease YncB( thermonuclease family)